MFFDVLQAFESGYGAPVTRRSAQALATGLATTSHYIYLHFLSLKKMGATLSVAAPR